MDVIPFIAACLSLLATPGPTNTLLATSGAEAGWRRSLQLLVAELAGYLLAIGVLRFALGPIIASRPIFEAALQAVVAAYLIYLAMKLWHRGGLQLTSGSSVTFARVFATTLLNPKGLIFAFTILPSTAGLSALLPWLGALSALIVIVGFAWTVLGSSLHRSFQNPAKARIGYRVSATILALLAGLLIARSFATA